MFSPVIFREYDIRGVYNEQFDLDFAYKLGKAFTSYVFGKTAKKALRFSIGYDARTSSLDIVKKLAAGMSESGAEARVSRDCRLISKVATVMETLRRLMAGLQERYSKSG